MDRLIDIIGATVLWSFIVLIMLRVNAQISDNAFETLNTSIAQMEAIDLGSIVEFDFRKVGDLITGDKIIIADSNQTKFYFDYNFDGSTDSISYSIGTTSDLSSTDNPNDKPLYRNFNNSSNIVGNISSFKLTYFDASGKQINYGALSSQTNRDLIKTIQVYFLRESIYANYDGFYVSMEWVRKISPKNI